MSGIGGGATPSENYPAYMRTMHEAWLTDLDSFLQNALYAGSPYASAQVYDPEEQLDLIDARFGIYADFIDTLSESGNWTAFANAGRTYFDNYLFDNSYMLATKQNIEKRSTETLMRSMGRLAAGLSSVNCVNSSMFSNAMAQLETAFIHDMNDAEAKLWAQRDQNKLTFVMSGIADMTKLLGMHIDSLRGVYSGQADNARVRILATREFYNEDLQLAAQDATYELGLFQHGSNLLSAMAGTALIPKAPNQIGSALSGALTAAATVAPLAFQAGPQVGAIATIGAAIVGGVGGYMNTL